MNKNKAIFLIIYDILCTMQKISSSPCADMVCDMNEYKLLQKLVHVFIVCDMN